MSALTAAPVTMSSRDIAQLVKTRHDTVKRTIERLAERGVMTLPPLAEKPSTGGRPSSEYRVGKRDSYVIVAQLSPEFTARLVDRWQELEERAAQSLPAQAPIAALVDLARLTLEHLPNLGHNSKQALLSVLTEQALGHKVIPLPRVEEHLMPAGEVGALLGVSANKIGRLANANGLKVAPYGEFRLDKARHSSKQVESFHYSSAGVERLRELLSVKAAA